jgi:hypothetical protein
MSTEGRIAVDVSFADSGTATGVQSLKKIAITDTTGYTTGKVAILSGTCGTAAVNLTYSPTTYRNADGSLVSFTTIERIAYSSAGSNKTRLQDAEGDFAVYASSGRIACTDVDINPSLPSFDVRVVATSGTAAYSLVLYGT